MGLPDGIDVSEWQTSLPDGPWLFCVVKATEGLRPSNKRLGAQWNRASQIAELRGLYHYARPLASTGARQAEVFAQVALNIGFKPGHDLWQLDCEGTGNDGCSGTTWRVFVDDFMRRASQLLGNRGLLYCGRYFHADAIQPWRFPWWLPDYGTNDNARGEWFNPAPLVHQYTTSHNTLDRNYVYNVPRWRVFLGESDGLLPSDFQKDEDNVHQIFIDDKNAGPDGASPRLVAINDQGDIILGNGAKVADDADRDHALKGVHFLGLVVIPAQSVLPNPKWEFVGSEESPGGFTQWALDDKGGFHPYRRLFRS